MKLIINGHEVEIRMDEKESFITVYVMCHGTVPKIFDELAEVLGGVIQSAMINDGFADFPIFDIETELECVMKLMMLGYGVRQVKQFS